MDFGYGKLSKDVQAIRNSFVHLDGLALNARYSDHVRVNKALSLVWMSAAIEQFWKSFLAEVCLRVSRASAHKRRKNLASSAIYYFDSLGTMGEGKAIKRWQRAVDLLTAFPSAPPSPFALPYDGKTVRPEHILLAWSVFCLKGPEFPSPIHKQDLNTLAEQRNEIAHGLIAPSHIGGSLTISDLQRRLDRMDDIAIHCILSADAVWP